MHQTLHCMRTGCTAFPMTVLLYAAAFFTMVFVLCALSFSAVLFCCGFFCTSGPWWMVGRCWVATCTADQSLKQCLQQNLRLPPPPPACTSTL